MPCICIHLDCSKYASYNVLGQPSRYCGIHRSNDMIQVNANICINPDCSKYAIYNILGLKPNYCGTHKTIDMIYINANICINPDCSRIASFNILGQKARYCGTHKTIDMIAIYGNICINPDCSKIAHFNILGLKPKYCVLHKTENMIRINKHKTCITDLCETLVKNKYRGYCVRCFIHTFPTETVSRNYKTKERNVVDSIKQMFPDLDWKEDKIIACGCSKKRPDMFLDLAIFVIVIEIDENQHTDYDSNCENKRMMEISQDVGHRPVVFIRFNPDDYKNGSVKITSCWGVGANGLSVIKKCKIKEWKERTDALNNQIQFCIDNPTDKTIDVIHLFYDSL